MIGSTFWERLATRFDAITPHPLALRAEWRADGFDGTSLQWRVAGSDPDVEPFKQLATLGAVALGEPDGPHAYTSWLRRLSLDSADFQAAPLAPAQEVVQAIGSLSARFCRQLAAEAETRALRSRVRSRRAFPRRADWLRAKLAQRGETAHRFATLNGMDPRVVRRILDGIHVREDVLTRLGAALSSDARAIPSD